MKSTIQATFDNIDSAELTLSRMRENNISIYCSSIDRIDKNANTNINGLLFSTVAGHSDESHYRLMNFPFASRKQTNLNENIRRDVVSKDVVLKINLPETHRKRAVQVLINMHGREITEKSMENTTNTLNLLEPW